MITIFTSTYNRCHTLERLYESLCRQTSFDFEWLVVDDGSTDDTKEYIQSLSEDRFAIRYYYQPNGGKHRAINRGVKLANGEWFFIVDSDDYLTDNAISFLYSYLKEIEEDNRYCGVVTLRITPDYATIGIPCVYDVLDTDFLSLREKYKMTGDSADIIRTCVLKEYPFPDFENEKFCTEAVVWNRIAQKYIVKYIKKGVYVCKYLPGGLTDTYNQIMDESPCYSMIYFKELISYNQVPLLKKVSFLVRYLHYSKIVGFHYTSDVYPTLKMFFLLPFVPLIYVTHYLKGKFRV